MMTLELHDRIYKARYKARTEEAHCLERSRSMDPDLRHVLASWLGV